jgi:hypothetical protein
MSTAAWHEPPTTLPGPSETLIEEVCGGIAIAGIDRERRRGGGCFSGLGRPRTGERVQQGPAPGLGQARRAAWEAGPQGSCAAGKAVRQREESGRMRRDFGRVRPHHRSGRGLDETLAKRKAADLREAFWRCSNGAEARRRLYPSGAD